MALRKEDLALNLSIEAKRTMSDIKEYYDPTVDSKLRCDKERYPAQTFLTTSAYRLDLLHLKLSKAQSSSAGVLSVELFATTGGEPTGDALADASKSISSLSTSATWETFSMQKIALANATTYAIVIKSNNQDPIHRPYWHGLETGAYADGTAFMTTDTGGTWTDSSRDQAFKLYGSSLLPAKAWTPTPVDDATEQAVETAITWAAGDDYTTSFDVYFDEDTNPPTTKVVNNADVNIYTPPANLTVDADHYWRVDAKNAYGTTTGDVWKFTTSAKIPVSTPAEFQAIKDNPSASYYLVNDIDMDGESYTPIGNFTDGIFTGIVDGADFTVSNITIDDAASDYQGVFGLLSTGAYIYDLKIVDVDITADDRVGGLVGWAAAGTITNCSVTGTVSADDFVGGLVGYMSAGVNISGCSSAVTVVSDQSIAAVGGLIGFSGGGTIATSYATGDVTASGTVSSVGGFVGDNSATISNCYATGDVTGNNTAGNTGGFIGYQRSSTITNAYSVGAVSTGALLGGFIGFNLSGTLVSCYYDTTTSGQSDTGKGVPKTTANMKKELTFVDWDFSTPVWYIIEDDIYPVFDPVYILGDTYTGTDDNDYVCSLEHLETTDTIPITGDDWADYWLLGDELMVRMIPFVYSSAIAYECEFGGSYIRFFYNGAALMDNGSHVEVVAPYLQADLFELNVEQVGDVMWITHPNYAQRKLSRVSATEFSLDAIVFKKGPFLLRNDLIDPDVQDTAKMSISGLTIATATVGVAGTGTFTITSASDISSLFPPNKPFAVYGSTGNDANYTVHATEATTYVGTTVTIYVNEVIDDATDDGKILVVGATDTLVSTGEIFDDPDHVGALFKLVHPRLLKEISLSGAGTTKAIEVKGTARYVSTGRWSGTWHVQRNQNSSGWEDYRTYKGLTDGARNDSLAFTEKEDNVFYRINAEAGISTDFGATLTVNNPIQEGIVEITAVTDENNATVEIIKLPASTVATRRWAEGAWSPLRGYPASVTFHGNRCVYAGESPIVSQIVPD